MSDPVEAALRAIEDKYLPEVMEGKSLMPFYPRKDVAIMIAAAVNAEREACAQACEAESNITQGPSIAKWGDYYADIIRARSNPTGNPSHVATDRNSTERRRCRNGNRPELD